MTEAQLQLKVLRWFSKQPGFWRKISSSHFQRAGFPDIVGVRDGYAYFIELKNESYGDHPERGLTPEQEEVRDKIIAAGGRYLCANSLEAVMAFVGGT